VTPDGVIVGHTGGSFGWLVTPQGFYTGDFGNGTLVINTPSTSVVISANPFSCPFQ
jgi:hypothetical protein